MNIVVFFNQETTKIMALHPNLQSMLLESLPEMLFVAKYSIEYQKDKNMWLANGCYGFPAALLLLSITDSIGSYVKGGSVKNHFKVLNEDEYYGLQMSDDEIEIMYQYRNLLSHNTLMSPEVGLSKGTPNDLVLKKAGEKYWLSLVPYHNVSIKAVIAFLSNQKSLISNPQILDIIRKSNK